MVDTMARSRLSWKRSERKREEDGRRVMEEGIEEIVGSG